MERGIVVVTGAGSGIGAAVCRRLSSRRDVWGADVDRPALDRLAGELPALTVEEVDVRSTDEVERFVSRAASTGRFDAMIACAGVSCVGTVVEPDPGRWQRTIDVNTLGVMFSVRAALPAMRAQGFGTIVVVASASGRLSYIGEPAYIASKHAAVAFCDAVRKEVVGSGVRMSVVEPGLVDTPMSRGHPMIDEVLGSVTPLDPDDIARAIEFVVDLPAHCAVNELLIRPTNQDL